MRQEGYMMRKEGCMTRQEVYKVRKGSMTFILEMTHEDGFMAEVSPPICNIVGY